MNGRPERGDVVRPWIAMAKRVRKVVLLNLPRELAPLTP
jgi:hypothetical protein